MLFCKYETIEKKKGSRKIEVPKKQHMCHEQLAAKGYEDPIIAYGGMWSNTKEKWTERFWVFDANTGNDFCGMCVEIHFCPFCGEKLQSNKK